MFIIAIALLMYSLKDKNGFDMIWRYFAWCNQTLAVFTLWALTVYLTKEKLCYWVTLIPALFMTAVCSTYIVVAPEGFGINYEVGLIIGLLAVVVSAFIFFAWKRRQSVC